MDYEPTITVKLRTPIDVEGRKVTEVIIREPLVRDLKAFETLKGSESDKAIRLASSLSDLPPSAFEELMTAFDFKQVEKAVQSFLPDTD